MLGDAKLSEILGQVAKAARMIALVLMEDAKHLLAAGCEQKVVTSDSIFNDRQQFPALLRIQRVPGGHVNGVVVVNAAP